MKCMRVVVGIGVAVGMLYASSEAASVGKNRRQMVRSYGNLPLKFEANQGQADGQIHFLSRGRGYTLFLTEDEAVLSLRRPASEDAEVTISDVVRLKLIGASTPSKTVGIDEQIGRSNYLIGKDPAQWTMNIPSYGKVSYHQVYPGVDLVFYGTTQGQLEYDFVIAPGADPDVIRFGFEGAQKVTIGERGNLRLVTAGGEVMLKAPLAYQEIGGQQQTVGSCFVIKEEAQIAFQIAEYDTTQPLVIDPILVYSTFLGGNSGGDVGNGIAVDDAGNIYLAGSTNALDFPVNNPFQTTLQGNRDIYIVKLDPSGSAILFATYLGGSDDEEPATLDGLAVDSAGNVYMTGYTKSSDFPVHNPIQATYGGGDSDVFVLKLNSSGAALDYATYLGGNSGFEMGRGIAVDQAGHAYITGWTSSPNFPILNAFQSALNGSSDIFITKVNPAGSNWVYSTFLGGSGGDSGAGITMDDQDNVFVTGGTSSPDFPVQNAYQPNLSGSASAIVTKLNASGSALIYSTYFGGGLGANQIVVDAAGNAYITGNNDMNLGAVNLPIKNPVQPAYGGGIADIFLTGFNSAGSDLVLSTHLGGSSRDDGHKLALDQSGNIYITGRTESTDFPIQDPIQAAYGGGGQDVFVAKINVNNSSLDFSTYLGGTASEVGYDIVVDSADNIYLTGGTQSANFPTQNPLHAYHGGGSGDIRNGSLAGDAFITQILFGSLPVTVTIPDTTATYLEQLNVPVRVDDTTGKDIVSAEIFLAYDGDLLSAISSGTSGTLLTGDWSVETNLVEGVGTSIDTIKMAMATDDDVLAGAGTLINVDFQVADIRHPASSPLPLTHVLFNDGTPDYAKTDGSVTLIGTDGVITSLPSEILPRWSIGVSVYDLDEDRNTGTRDAFDVGVANGSQIETLAVAETGNSTGVFSGVIGTAFSLSFSSDDGIIQAKTGDQIVFSYADSLDSNGDTQMRTDITDVLGGTDGLVRTTVVSQPGDTVRVRVSDADLSDAVAVSVANPRTGETESILLSQFTSGESHFYGRFFTETQAGAVGDSTLQVAKGDILGVTYADTLTANGGTAAVADDDEVVDPFGDAHPNGSVQAFDAAQVLIHRLSTYGGGAGMLSGLDSLSANLDQGAPFGIIDGYDASLILRKVVGLISRFEVQEPDAVNHPQPETATRPKPVPEERMLALVARDGYVSVWCEDRGEIVSGELTLTGVQGQVVMGEELREFLSVSQATDGGMQVVFAGSEAVLGPGELLRIAGLGSGDARLTQASFNGGRIDARWEEGIASVRVPASFVLYPNVPNPFNPETVIRFALARESQVRLEVFDVVGQRVRTLVGERLPSGTHQALWDGRGESGESVSSGVYFCRLQAQYAEGAFAQVGRMLLLK